jgi:hypothetical protein
MGIAEVIGIVWVAVAVAYYVGYSRGEDAGYKSAHTKRTSSREDRP